MFQIINWLCLISVGFLVLDIMIYFCKDAINILKVTSKTKVKNVEKTRVSQVRYEYQNKIAK